MTIACSRPRRGVGHPLNWLADATTTRSCVQGGVSRSALHWVSAAASPASVRTEHSAIQQCRGVRDGSDSATTAPSRTTTLSAGSARLFVSVLAFHSRLLLIFLHLTNRLELWLRPESRKHQPGNGTALLPSSNLASTCCDLLDGTLRSTGGSPSSSANASRPCERPKQVNDAGESGEDSP
jgi:hypothetical protein